MKEETASILIVEGENLSAKDLERPLANFGYRIAGVVDSGPEAVEAAEQIRPDVALMDTQLTGSMDSFAVAGEIRNRLRIPTVFLISNDEEDTAQRHNGTALYAYVAKPFRSIELNATILLALNQKRLLQEIFAKQAWLATLLQSLNDAVVATDAKGRVSFLNAAAEALTGCALEDVIGVPIEQICSLRTLEGEDVRESQLLRVLRVREATPRQRFLLTVQSGLPVPIEESAAPIVEHGELLGAVAVFRDISEVLSRENHLERQRELAEAQMHVAAEALGQTRSDLRALSKHLIDSHEAERQRLAKTFHDDFSQRTALLGLQVDSLSETLGNNGEAMERLSAIRSQLERLSEGLRRTSHNLHPSVLSDLGFLPALRGLALDFQASGLDVILRSIRALSAEPAAETAIALYRIAEETIRMLGNHSSTTSPQIQVSVSEEEGHLRMVIEDGGTGLEANAENADAGLWILNMQERARSIGGTVFLGELKRRGTQVLVRVPLS